MDRRFDYLPRDRYIYPRIRNDERHDTRDYRQYRPEDRTRNWEVRPLNRYPYPPRRYPFISHSHDIHNSHYGSHPMHHNMHPMNNHSNQSSHSNHRPPFPERYHSNYNYRPSPRRTSPRRGSYRQRYEEEDRKRTMDKGTEDNKTSGVSQNPVKLEVVENKERIHNIRSGNTTDSDIIIPSTLTEKNISFKEVVVSLDDEEDRLMQADWGNDSDDDSVVIEQSRRG